jgi:hypothetical protein
MNTAQKLQEQQAIQCLHLNYQDKILEHALLEKFIHLVATEQEFDAFVNKGRNFVVDYKAQGGTQRNAYNTLHDLDKVYIALKDDDICDRIEDILDCICGFAGNKAMWIWETRLENS